MVLINELIGSFGKYHWWLCFIVYINKFGIAFHHMSIIFLAPPVKFTCKPDPGINCCDDPIYNTSIFSRTIVTEWNLICGRSWLKDFTQTILQLGVLIGSLFFGIASDKWGRRPTLIASVILEVVMGILASFAPDYWSFTCIRFLLGFSIGGVMVVGFVIIMEYVGNKNRDVISALYQIPFNMGHMLLALFGYYLRDFANFQLAISVTNIVLLIYICVLPETPRWYLATNKTEKAVKLMTRVAKFNGKPTDQIAEKMEVYQQERLQNAQKKGTTIDLFRTPNLRKNIIIMSFSWLTCSYCFYGIAQYISQLTGNIFINVAASGAVSMISVLCSIPLMRFMGRRTVVISCNFGCSICLFLLAFSPDGIISTCLACLGVFFSFAVFVVVYLYCSEMFPTVVRNAAIGISSMMARVGSMLAPFVAGLKPHGRWCAPVAFGIFPLIAAFLCFLLPETKNCELMNTIQEGEDFGKKPRRTPSPENTIPNSENTSSSHQNTSPNLDNKSSDPEKKSPKHVNKSPNPEKKKSNPKNIPPT